MIINTINALIHNLLQDNSCRLQDLLFGTMITQLKRPRPQALTKTFFHFYNFPCLTLPFFPKAYEGIKILGSSFVVITMVSLSFLTMNPALTLKNTFTDYISFKKGPRGWPVLLSTISLCHVISPVYSIPLLSTEIVFQKGCHQMCVFKHEASNGKTFLAEKV